MMRSWIHFTRGRFVRQARIGLDEANLREEHLSRQGFAGPVAMLYRTDGPNEVVRIEGDYRPRAVDSADVVAPDADDPRGGWQTLLTNQDVAVAISRRRHAMPYCYRDMAGDLLYFVHRGRGTFATEFGPIAYEPGDWVFLPKATTFQQLPEPGDSLLLVVESPQPIRLAEHENVGRHTPFDPTMLDVPDVADYLRPPQDEYEVRMKHEGGHSSIFYRNDPLKGGRLEGRPLPVQAQCPAHHAAHVRPDPHPALVMGDLRGAGVLRPDDPAPGRGIRHAIGGTALLSPQHRHGRSHADPCRRRPLGPPPGRLPPHPARHPARRHRSLPRRIPEEAQAGMHRTATMVGVDTYRPLNPTPEFAKMAG